MVTNRLERDQDLTVEQWAFRHSTLSECERTMFAFVSPVEYVDNLRLMQCVFFPIDFVLYEEYSNEYFSLFHNILIERQVNDLHVYFSHEFHRSIHCNVDDRDPYFDSKTYVEIKKKQSRRNIFVFTDFIRGDAIVRYDTQLEMQFLFKNCFIQLLLLVVLIHNLTN